MYLKSIRVQGFKTFARRTELPFSRGITAIVGPNGSGKSNLVDAIRWALGERNARGLRGQRMEDVIYSGGPGKSGMGMAEVILVLDNAEQRLNVEFTEVEVARRLYRSGESEYLVNGARARLRDIDALLASTGLRQDGYAVTAQNDIDFVIQAAPPVRRELIEEAAGVRRLRAERQEAVTRLAEAERDLRRARDLLGELAPRAEELREQAVAATEYQKVADALKALQGSLARDAWRKAMVTVRRASTRQRAAQAKRDAAKAALEAFEPVYHEHRAALAAAQQARWSHQQAVADLRLLVAESQHQVRIVAERAQAVAQALEAATRERDRLADSARAGTQVVQGLEDELRELEAAGAALDAEVLEATQAEQAARAAVAALEVRRAGLLQQGQDLHRRQLSAAGEMRQLDGRIQFLQEQCQQAGMELETAQSRAAALGDELRQQEEATDASQAAVERRMDELAGSDVAVAEAVRALAAAEQDAAAAAGTRQAKEAELAALVAVRERLTQLSPLNGHEPSLRRLIDCIQVAEENRLAVEAALEGCLDGWFATDQSALEYALARLADGSEPRESVLFDPGTPDGGALPDGLSPVSALIEAPEAVARALRALLGGVAVAEDAAAARRVLTRFPSLTVVTLTGERLGASSYRAGRDADAPLHQQAQQRGLTESVEQARRSERALRDRVDSLGHALVTAQAVQAQARADLDAAQARHTELMSTLAAARIAVDHATGEVARVADQFTRLDGLLGVARAAQEEARREEERIDGEARHAREELPRVQAALGLAEQELATQLRRRQNFELQAAIRRQRRDDLVRQADRARTVCQEHGDALAQRNAALAELEAQPEQLAVEIEAARAEVGRRQGELAALESTPPPDAEAVGVLERELRDDEQRNVALQVDCAHAEDGLTAATLEVESAEAEVERCADALRDDGGGVEEAEDETAAEVDWQKTEREVNRLQRRLEAMGAVNLLAPQEYAQLSERCQALDSQLADLSAASEQLTELRHRLEREIDERFRSVFQAVAANFQEFFAELFEGGGRATLRLSGETDDPLDEGVEILAQTPGKRLQALTLLSGGERALTALAFLFALQAVNPSPFYVLDEVDAALDDANVVRFNRVLSRLAQNQQFLVVTHNHSTMAQAEVLYGVTLGEHGISQMVSVRLQEAAASVRLRERSA